MSISFSSSTSRWDPDTGCLSCNSWILVFRNDYLAVWDLATSPGAAPTSARFWALWSILVMCFLSLHIPLCLTSSQTVTALQDETLGSVPRGVGSYQVSVDWIQWWYTPRKCRNILHSLEVVVRALPSHLARTLSDFRTNLTGISSTVDNCSRLQVERISVWRVSQCGMESTLSHIVYDH